MVRWVQQGAQEALFRRILLRAPTPLGSRCAMSDFISHGDESL
jgi:hypothetical protein